MSKTSERMWRRNVNEVLIKYKRRYGNDVLLYFLKHGISMHCSRFYRNKEEEILEDAALHLIKEMEMKNKR